MRVEAGKDEKENRQIIEYIKMKALETSRCKIYGKNILIRDLVQFFWETEAMEAEFFMLTTTDGLILAFFEVGRWEENMAGYRVSLDELRRFGQKVSFLKDIPGYATVVMGAEQVREKIQDIHGTIAGILQIFDQREQRNQYLLDCLDYVQNAISIFDKDVRLMYANKPYFDDYHIADRNAPIGMYIEDITQKYGLNFVSFEKISERYKMLEVIKKGKEAVDWEIRLEVASSDKPPRLVSNDMFPIKDERGKVEGLIEITHSRQQDVKRARKMVDFRRSIPLIRLLP